MKKQRFGILLVTLAILFVGTGLLDYTGRLLHSRVATGLSILLLAQVLIVAVVSVRTRWRWAGVTIRVLVAGAIGGQLMILLVQHPAMRVAADVMAVLCLGYGIVVLLDHLMDYRFPSEWVPGLWIRLRGTILDRHGLNDIEQFRGIVNYDIPVF